MGHGDAIPNLKFQIFRLKTLQLFSGAKSRTFAASEDCCAPKKVALGKKLG